MIVRTGTAVCHCNMPRGLQSTLSGPAWNTPGYPGNRGALVRRENRGEWAHFFLATYWQDLAAVKAFAGEDYHVAVTYPDDEIFELLSDPYVFQHEVEAVSPL